MEKFSFVTTQLVYYLPIYFVICTNSSRIVLNHRKIGQRLVIYNGHRALSTRVKWQQALATFTFFDTFLLISLWTNLRVDFQKLLNIESESIILGGIGCNILILKEAFPILNVTVDWDQVFVDQITKPPRDLIFVVLELVPQFT